MLHFLGDYAVFLAKMVTFIIAILALLVGIFAIVNKNKERFKESLDVKKINERYKKIAAELEQALLPKAEYKRKQKQAKKHDKQIKEQKNNKRVFIVNFNGDLKASAANSLREEINAILLVATPNDEVVVRLESPGGMVPNYGLAASQLQRVRDKNIHLVIAVDKVAASGGYLMACVADKILAAPFAYIGSIGVVAQLPNFNRLLKKNNIEFEQITAGEFKRTLTLFGENTEQGRRKVKEDVEEIQELFKGFIKRNRPQVDINQVATGEHWPATRALELNLVDQIVTSDDYLLNAMKNSELYEITYSYKKNLSDKLSHIIHATIDKIFFNKHW